MPPSTAFRPSTELSGPSMSCHLTEFWSPHSRSYEPIPDGGKSQRCGPVKHSTSSTTLTRVLLAAVVADQGTSASLLAVLACWGKLSDARTCTYGKLLQPTRVDGAVLEVDPCNVQRRAVLLVTSLYWSHNVSIAAARTPQTASPPRTTMASSGTACPDLKLRL